MKPISKEESDQLIKKDQDLIDKILNKALKEHPEWWDLDEKFINPISWIGTQISRVYDLSDLMTKDDYRNFNYLNDKIRSSLSNLKNESIDDLLKPISPEEDPLVGDPKLLSRETLKVLDSVDKYLRSHGYEKSIKNKTGYREYSEFGEYKNNKFEVRIFFSVSTIKDSQFNQSFYIKVDKKIMFDSGDSGFMTKGLFDYPVNSLDDLKELKDRIFRNLDDVLEI